MWISYYELNAVHQIMPSIKHSVFEDIIIWQIYLLDGLILYVCLI
jgi:hypothetical protein